MNKPFAGSCEENKHVILDVLKKEFSNTKHVLEIASGTAQHAVFFTQHMPQLIWQCSDRHTEINGIKAWLEDANLPNLLSPLELDVLREWPTQQYDAIFSANAVHIMSWQAVEAMFNGIKNCLANKAILCLYGPFNYNGNFTSESNAQFDRWLKSRDPQSGIRDFEKLNTLAEQCGLKFKKDYKMPANNRILCWQK